MTTQPPIQVGDTATRTFTVTPEAVRDYAHLTGDHNPLHFDETFVAGTRFQGLIAQGGLATGMLHALVAMDLPGPGTVFLKQAWTFPNPALIGDTLTATGTILTWRPNRAMGTMHFQVTNTRDETVLEGEATVMQVAPTD
ncbi:MAG: MaoC family dehydratase [Dehalococcoidia bacterium]|jgi:3-hydroxybutyryl-CoA dehydratase|nr:MaoC family dehydratase [Dehalococcoidia bacterium]